MKVSELFEKSLIAPSSFDKTGSPMKLPNQYKNVDYGKATKARPMTITVRSSGKGHQVYGRRTIMSK